MYHFTEITPFGTVTNRHRLEVNEQLYDSVTGSLFPKVWTNLFDGSVFKGAVPREANNSPGHERAPTDPDVGIFSGDLRAASFDAALWPLFMGVGIIPPPGETIHPGNLILELDIDQFFINGQTVHQGRACSVIRTQKQRGASGPFYEFWVDMERESAIVRFAKRVGSSLISDTDISYQKTREGWLPSGWNYTYFGGDSAVIFSKQLRIKELVLDPPLDDSVFQLQIEPGMLVKKINLSELDKGGPIIEKEATYYRAETGDKLSEVVFVNGVEQRRWVWWPLWGAIPLCVVGAALLVIHLRRRKMPE